MLNNFGEEFKLWDNNPDSGAWITYGTRYTQEQLQFKQQQLLDVLDLDIIFEDSSEEISVKMKDGGKPPQRVLILLEELACVNEALSFHMNQSEFAGKGLNNLLSLDLRIFINRDSVEGKNKVDLYNEIDIGWGQIIGDIAMAHQQNSILTQEQQLLFRKLIASRDRAIELLQGRHIILQA